MEELAGMRYKIINQIVKTFIDQEKKFFGTCYCLIDGFYKNMTILDQPLPYQKSTYNPMKYIRANKIMEGVDASTLPDIKMKDKYSLNNYKSGNIQRNNNMLNNNNEIINKKYSFEDYKLRKSNLVNNNQNKVNNISTINNNNIQNNKNNDSNPVNPYSYEAYKKRTQSLDVLKRSHQNNNNNNENANFYQSNLNLVMNSIIGKETKNQLNPFSNMRDDEESNPYCSMKKKENKEIKENRENPYAIKKSDNDNPFNFNNNLLNSNININNGNYISKENNLDDIENPYLGIFKNQNNSSNNNSNVINSFFNNNFGKNQKNDNNNNNPKKPQDKYNFGF